MASRATGYLAPAFRSGFRSPRTGFRASERREMATDSAHSTQFGDMPWIIGSGAILVPTVRPSDAFISRLQKYGLKFRLYGVRSLGSYPQARGRSTHHAPKNHAKATEAVKEDTEEPAPEPVTTEPTPKPVPEEKSEVARIRARHIIQVTPEPSTLESTTSDNGGVVIPVEEVEESITKAIEKLS